MSLNLIFQRSISAHLPLSSFQSLQDCPVLVAGLGGGSNIAELLVRKGFGELSLADPDHYEEHNIRQRGCSQSTLNVNKTIAMSKKLMDIQPYLKVHCFPEGVTFQNIPQLVSQNKIVIDMLDFSALQEKIALCKETQRQGKYLLTAPSIVNGAALFVFSPTGISLGDFLNYDTDSPWNQQALQQMKKIIPFAPPEAPMEMYLDAAMGNRTIPLDAVGVDQAAVMTVCAAENIALNRWDRIISMPKALRIDASNPLNGFQIHDYSCELHEAIA